MKCFTLPGSGFPGWPTTRMAEFVCLHLEQCRIYWIDRQQGAHVQSRSVQQRNRVALLRGTGQCTRPTLQRRVNQHASTRGCAAPRMIKTTRARVQSAQPMLLSLSSSSEGDKLSGAVIHFACLGYRLFHSQPTSPMPCLAVSCFSSSLPDKISDRNLTIIHCKFPSHLSWAS